MISTLFVATEPSLPSAVVRRGPPNPIATVLVPIPHECGTIGCAGPLGVATTCGTPPGTISVLVPLPFPMRNPCPPLPGTVVVSNEPRLPVMNAGPLDVITD